MPKDEAGCAARVAASRASLLHLIVRGFARDDDIVYVTFAEASDGDAHEPGALLQFRERRRAAIAHAASQPSHELVHQGAKLPLVRHAAFDALRDGLAALGAFLRVPVGGTRLHGAQRTHAAICLERTPLVEN